MATGPTSVRRPGTRRGASGLMPAPYDGERRVRREGQKGPRGFLRVDLSSSEDPGDQEEPEWMAGST